MKEKLKKYGPAMAVLAVIAALYYWLSGDGTTQPANFGDRAAPGLAPGQAPDANFVVSPATPANMTTPGYQRWNYAPVTFNFGNPDFGTNGINGAGERSGGGTPAAGSGSNTGCGCECDSCNATAFQDGPGNTTLAPSVGKQAAALKPALERARGNAQSFDAGDTGQLAKIQSDLKAGVYGRTSPMDPGAWGAWNRMYGNG